MNCLYTCAPKHSLKAYLDELKQKGISPLVGCSPILSLVVGSVCQKVFPGMCERCFLILSVCARNVNIMNDMPVLVYKSALVCRLLQSKLITERATTSGKMTSYNDDELHPPSWLSKEFFRKTLVECENDESVMVKNVTIVPGTAKGDHYASVMFRATITYDSAKSKNNTKSVVIKTMPEADGLKKEMFEESYIFETEISMFNNAIPALEAELRKIGDDTVLGAKMLYHSLERRKCIILEDLVPKGYTTLKGRLLNLVESKAALLKLAKWHAVSYKLVADGNESIAKYSEGFFNMKGTEQMPVITTGIDNFIALMQKDEDLKKYVPKLQAIGKDIVRKSIQSTTSYREDPRPPGIYSLCHGDFHSKNLMFKWNDKKELEDIMLLDFQLSYFGPAVLDVLYAMYMMFDDDVRRDHRDELIYYYASNFIDTLKRLYFEGTIPKVSDFYIEILRHRHYEVCFFTTFLPLYVSLSTGEEDADELFTSNELRMKLYGTPRYLNEVKRLFPTLLYRGFFE